MARRIAFLNLFLDDFDLDESENIEPGTNIISLNAEQVVLAQKDLDFKGIICSSGLIVPDGSGVVLAAKFLYGERLYKVAGIDLAEKLINEKNKIAILGSTQKVVDLLTEKYKNKIVFAHNGFFSEEKENEIVEKIVESKAELLLVGMGAPKQEKFIYKHRKKLEKTISMGIGGALDVFAGVKKRAPKLFISLHLEWLYRLIAEPFRIKRIFLKLPSYLFLIFVYKLKKG